MHGRSRRTTKKPFPLRGGLQTDSGMPYPRADFCSSCHQPSRSGMLYCCTGTRVHDLTTACKGICSQIFYSLVILLLMRTQNFRSPLGIKNPNPNNSKPTKMRKAPGVSGVTSAAMPRRRKSTPRILLRTKKIMGRNFSLSRHCSIPNDEVVRTKELHPLFSVPLPTYRRSDADPCVAGTW